MLVLVLVLRDACSCSQQQPATCGSTSCCSRWKAAGPGGGRRQATHALLPNVLKAAALGWALCVAIRSVQSRRRGEGRSGMAMLDNQHDRRVLQLSQGWQLGGALRSG